MGVAAERFRERVSRLKTGWAEVQARPDYQERERERELDAAAHAKWLAKERLLGMGIPLIHALDIIESRFAPNPVDAHVGAFDAGLRTLLILAGGVGSTKTSAACRWLGGHGGRFIHVHELAHASTFDAEWGAIKGASHLVIDDLGTEVASKSEWIVGKVREVIEHRVAHLLPVIVTTNLTQGMVTARYGDEGGRLIDRLKAHGEWFDVPVFNSQRKPPEVTP